MRLIFIHGPAASGKLTVARELARLTALPLFHNHLVVDAVAALFPFGSAPFVRLREETWLAHFREAAEADHSLIFTFAPERTVRPEFIARTIETVESRGGRVVFVALTCAPDEIERRIEAPSRAQFGKLASKAFFRELQGAGAFDFPPLPDSGLTLDTGALAPEAAAVKIRDFLGLPAADAGG
jgi:acyl-CoA synthetase (AMP-forming)/AMP-acid ligase II